MSDHKVVQIFVNPLAFHAAEPPWAAALGVEADHEALLAYLVAPGLDASLGAVLDRYREISAAPRRQLFAPPADGELLDRVVWPLRHAKGCYALGNYLGTLALCGTVAEMMAILLFDVSRIRVGEREIDAALQQKLFGGKFEKLGQHRRVEVLLGLGLIDDETKAAYDIIRTTRRKYLHLYSAQHDDLARDARSAFDAAVTVVANGIGQEIRDGKIIFRDSMVRFMEERGLVDAKSPASGSTGADDS